MEEIYTFVESDVWLILRAAGCTPIGGHYEDHFLEQTFKDPNGKEVTIRTAGSPQSLKHNHREQVLLWLQERGWRPTMQEVLTARTVQELSRVSRGSESLQGQVTSLASSVANLRAVLQGQQDPKMIRVWRFGDAPAEFRALSKHGGDEDWVAHVPANMKDDWIPWMEDGSSFGCCEISDHYLEDGSVIRIGAHA